MRPHRSAALRHLLHRWRPAATRRLDRRRRARPRPPRLDVGHHRLDADRRRPRSRYGHLPPRHGQGPEPACPAGDAAARLPLPRLGAAGAARRARRRHRAQRRRGSRLLTARRRARRPRASVRGGGRDQADGRRARAPRQERARAGRPLARGGADARLRALRPALRAAAADRGERRLRRRVARQRRRDPHGGQLHPRGGRSRPARQDPRHQPLSLAGAHPARPHAAGDLRPPRRSARRRRDRSHARRGASSARSRCPWSPAGSSSDWWTSTTTTSGTGATTSSSSPACASSSPGCSTATRSSTRHGRSPGSARSSSSSAPISPRQRRRATSPSEPRRGCAAPWTAATATSGGSKRATSAAWPAWTKAASTRACAATS